MIRDVAGALRERLDPRREPGRPFVTFYDDETGERTELSTTTYANWVAKTAGVLTDDLGLDAGDRVLIDLPTHWLGPVFLGAAWTAGLEVVTAGAAEVSVRGPSGQSGQSGQSGGTHLVCALLPFATASREPLPAGALDFGTLWPGQPDAYLGVVGGPGDPAYDGATQATLLDRPADDARVLTDVVPSTPAGVDLLARALLGSGSLVLVARPAEGSWEARAASERVDRVVRAQ